ncbi:hypothetical protein HPP92_008407 [Vanilla planifolia]|uniref:Uncharacterized protein n=1 Tax=Vanilla planifolia TaxID=51239 RepID=A0A835V4G1_VANPL|nr:hypothetical protein HPP92_008407 [Vanilla planifolia]
MFPCLFFQTMLGGDYPTSIKYPCRVTKKTGIFILFLPLFILLTWKDFEFPSWIILPSFTKVVSYNYLCQELLVLLSMIRIIPPDISFQVCLFSNIFIIFYSLSMPMAPYLFFQSMLDGDYPSSIKFPCRIT